MPTLIYVIASVLIYIEMFATYQILLTPRFSKKTTYILLTVGLALYFSGCFMPRMSPLRSVGMILLLLILVLVIYKNKWTQTVLIYALVNMLLVAVEYLTVLLQPAGVMIDWPFGVSVQILVVSYLLYLFALGVLLFILILITERIWHKSSELFDAKESTTISVLLAAELVILASCIYIVAYEELSSNRFELILAIIFSFVIADIAVVFSITSISRRQEATTRAAMLEQMVQAQKEYYAALTEQQENIRSMRHDIANHVLTMKLLLKEDKGAEVSDYLDDLQERYKSHSELGNCQNSAVDAFVFHKICQLREKNIRVTYQIELPEALEISNADLISAFGNLIDNCEEACESVENPSISITANVRSGYLRIETANPLPPVIPEEKKRRIPELERGVGTHILNSLAEKYNGRFNAYSEDGNYKTEMILKANT